TGQKSLIAVTFDRPRPNIMLCDCVKQHITGRLMPINSLTNVFAIGFSHRQVLMEWRYTRMTQQGGPNVGSRALSCAGHVTINAGNPTMVRKDQTCRGSFRASRV
ncbi:MAG: hypothetical protein ACI8VR_002219, partial [Candidatus Azotimanducaceae bacterium]